MILHHWKCQFPTVWNAISPPIACHTVLGMPSSPFPFIRMQAFDERLPLRPRLMSTDGIKVRVVDGCASSGEAYLRMVLLHVVHTQFHVFCGEWNQI